jgi:proline iminopeptidase
MPPFNKVILRHKRFYISRFSKLEDAPNLIFIHGGPGLNCGVIEYFIDHENSFKSLNYNIIFYDQRGCGRSKEVINASNETFHSDNVDDLHEIYKHLKSANFNISGFIGHSYGAKILFDFLKVTNLHVPAIFVSTANNISVPRLNNLTLDFAYLKKYQPEKYQKILSKLDNMSSKKIWELTEELAPLFHENKDRHHHYWANLEIFKKYKKAQGKINLPINEQVFMSVRKDLYLDEKQFDLNIESLASPYIWINGIHDYIMNGADSLSSRPSKVIPFLKSAHYPHLEENEHFCHIINRFLENIRS